MRLAILRDGRSGGDDCALASRGLATILALQITSRTAAHSAGVAAAHSTDGEREPVMGRGADRQRAIGEVRHTRFAKDSQEVHAGEAAG